MGGCFSRAPVGPGTTYTIGQDCQCHVQDQPPSKGAKLAGAPGGSLLPSKPSDDLGAMTAAEAPSCGGASPAEDVPCSVFAPELCCPWNEEDRLKSLQELGVLGKLPEPRFDTIVSLVKSIFGAQVAAVSLVEAEDISFHARAGEWACRAGRAGSFCDWIFIPPEPTMLIVEDALEDVRFRHNKYVEGPPGIRFYAGAPLVATDSGYRYGTLCVIDYQPRHFSAEQYAILAHFAEVVTRELERDKVLRWQQQALQAAMQEHLGMLRAMDCFSEGIMLCNPSEPGWPILYCNDAWVAITGVSRDVALGSGGFWRIFSGLQVDGRDLGPEEEEEAGAEGVLAVAAAARRAFGARVAPRAGAAGAGAAPSLAFEFKPSGTAEHLRDDVPAIGIPSIAGFGGQGAGALAGAPLDAGPCYYFGMVKGRDALLLAPGSLPASAGPDGSLSTSGPSPLITPMLSTAEPYRLSMPFSTVDSAPSLEGSEVGASRGGQGSQGLAPDQSAAGGPSCGDLMSREPEPIPAFRKMRPEVMDEVTLGPLLGSGSNGRCYRGVWHGGHVAVKILDCWVDPPQQPAGGGSGDGTEGELQTEAVLEAILSRSLSHPHVVTTFTHGVSTQEPGEGSASGKIHQQVWIVQSYCNKGTLFDAIERGMLRTPDGAPSLLAILQTACEIAGAMNYIHGQSILHGDLSPNNVLLTSSNKDKRRFIAQVADFGLSKAVAGREAVPTETIGTVTHMPPETLVDGMLSPATDVFSFGVMLWEMWEGRRAWKGLSGAQVMHAVSAGARQLEPQPSAPEWLQGLMLRCMDREPSRRPSFEAILNVLLPQLKAAKQEERPPSLDAPPAPDAPPSPALEGVCTAG